MAISYAHSAHLWLEFGGNIPGGPYNPENYFEKSRGRRERAGAR